MTPSLNRDDQHQLASALGYFELEMISDALEALDGIRPAAATHRDVLALRLIVLQKAENWSKAQDTAARLTLLEPTDPGWTIALAYATRRADCIEQAQEILRDAKVLHPGEALIHFNLACYACQLNHLDDARESLRAAFALDSNLRSQALKDADLKVLWPEIQEQKQQAK